MGDGIDDPSGLVRRTSSLTINSPARKLPMPPGRRMLRNESGIVIPDSEEERIQKRMCVYQGSLILTLTDLSFVKKAKQEKLSILSTPTRSFFCMPKVQSSAGS